MQKKTLAGFLAGVSASLMVACLLLVPSASAGTAFRVECIAPGDNNLFLLDPQTFSLPEELTQYTTYIGLCLAVQGHPRVQGDFFR